MLLDLSATSKTDYKGYNRHKEKVHTLLKQDVKLTRSGVEERMTKMQRV
jgi:hypothetical protein